MTDTDLGLSLLLAALVVVSVLGFVGMVKLTVSAIAYVCNLTAKRFPDGARVCVDQPDSWWHGYGGTVLGDPSPGPAFSPRFVWVQIDLDPLGSPPKVPLFPLQFNVDDLEHATEDEVLNPLEY